MPDNWPAWFQCMAWTSLGLACACAGVIAVDEFRHPQRMWIMNIVWPVTALFGSAVWLAAYWKWGRSVPAPHTPHTTDKQPFPAIVLKAASHCGAGCALGDLIAEWAAVVYPSLTVALGWHSLFAKQMYAVWVLDFILAFVLGIAFQYFTIQPMRRLSVAAGILAALRADFASITAWQVGMYSVMALIQLRWYPAVLGRMAPATTPEFWFAMQLAMLGGFVTAFPVNWLLIRIGWKEAM